MAKPFYITEKGNKIYISAVMGYCTFFKKNGKILGAKAFIWHYYRYKNKSILGIIERLFRVTVYKSIYGLKTIII